MKGFIPLLCCMTSHIWNILPTIAESPNSSRWAREDPFRVIKVKNSLILPNVCRCFLIFTRPQLFALHVQNDVAFGCFKEYLALAYLRLIDRGDLLQRNHLSGVSVHS